MDRHMEDLATSTKKDQEKGLAFIKERTDQLMQTWTQRFGVEVKETDLRTIAREFADLENDFAYVKEMNTYVAQRYDAFVKVLPTVTELDALLKETWKQDEGNKDFFIIEDKVVRIKKLETLRKAIMELNS